MSMWESVGIEGNGATSGGLSSWRGRGRGLSLPTPTTPPTMPQLPVGRGRGRGFSPLSPFYNPPPLEDYSQPVRCHLPSPLPIQYAIQMPLHIMMIYSHPNMPPFAFYSGSGIAVPPPLHTPQMFAP